MKIKDAKKYQEEFRKRPCNIVLAFDERQELNAVILQDKWRFRLIKEINKEEFINIMNENLTYDDSIAAEGDLKNSKIDVDNAKDSTLPEYMKYFYKAELI